MSPVRRSAKERSAPRRRPDGFGALGAPAAEEAVLGDDREAQAGGDEAVAQAWPAAKLQLAGSAGRAPSIHVARRRARL